MRVREAIEAVALACSGRRSRYFLGLVLVSVAGRFVVATSAAEDRLVKRLPPGNASVGDAARGLPAGPDLPRSTISHYQIHCARCHDSDGRGESGRELIQSIPDFTNQAWQSSRSDPQLRRAIREGKGKMMPAMGDKLGADDLVRLATLVRRFRGGRWVAPEKEDSNEPVSTPPLRTDAARVTHPGSARSRVPPNFTAERTVFQRSCQLCHGADGRGATTGSRLPGLPDFTSRHWQESRSQTQLEVSLREGKGEQMPGFHDKLTAQQVLSLVAFVRSFAPVRAKSLDTPTEDFDRGMDRLQREFEALRRAYRELSPDPTR